MATAKKDTGVVNIHGKEYKTVALRVNEFHIDYGQHKCSILTEIITCNEVRVLFKASIVDAEGRVRAAGHAEEFRKSGKINQTSALENAETSAIGRALAAFGYGGSEFASANEVQGAIKQQQTTIAPEKVLAINAFIENGKVQLYHLEQAFGHADVSKLLDVEADRIINGVQEKENAEDF